MAAAKTGPGRLFVPRRLVAEELQQFDLVPMVDRARAVVTLVPWLPAHGMTIGRFVFIRRSHAGRATLLAHELVHVRQYREMGYFRFSLKYLMAYARNLVRFRFKHQAAYRAIPVEHEAYRLAGAWIGAAGAARRHADEVEPVTGAAPAPGTAPAPARSTPGRSTPDRAAPDPASPTG
jgi:hypothetical protein